MSSEGPRSVPSDHPDRIRWNARYAAGGVPSFSPYPLAARALALDLPDGPVADLACGPSGSALLAAAKGRRVTAVDVSEVALRLLGDEARRRGLAALITLVHTDLSAWSPEPRSTRSPCAPASGPRRCSRWRSARWRTAACWPRRPSPPRPAARARACPRKVPGAPRARRSSRRASASSTRARSQVRRAARCSPAAPPRLFAFSMDVTSCTLFRASGTWTETCLTPPRLPLARLPVEQVGPSATRSARGYAR